MDGYSSRGATSTNALPPGAQEDHGGVPSSSTSPIRGERLVLDQREDSTRSVSSIMQIAMQQHEEFLVARRRRHMPALEEPPAPPLPEAHARWQESNAPHQQLPEIPGRTSKRFPRGRDVSSNSNSNGSSTPRPADVQRSEPDLANYTPEEAARRVARTVCDKCGDIVRVDKFAVMFQCPHCSTLSYAGSRLTSPEPPAALPQSADPSSQALNSSACGVSI